MKTRFGTFDVVCGVMELQRLIGMRVNQIYDIDNKTYLIRLQAGETKVMLLIESGIRFHTTAFEWPKNAVPSGFSMKLRKHLKNKRLEHFQQMGVDRIVDLQFGTGDAEYHVIVELYDRGNIILTDNKHTILYILRPHYEGEEVRLVVREKYPVSRARESRALPDRNELARTLEDVAPNASLKRILIPFLDCGPSIIDHVLTKHGLISCVLSGRQEEEDIKNPNKNAKKTKKNKNIHSSRIFDMESDMETLMLAIQEANEFIEKFESKDISGYVIQSREQKPSVEGGTIEFFNKNIEYHPYLFAQCESSLYMVFETFMGAVDEFFSSQRGQKIEMQVMQQEREVIKKLSNVKNDHLKRLEELTESQVRERQKAELIIRNQAMVDNIIFILRSSIARQMSWSDIGEMLKAAQDSGDTIACAIKQLKLEINHVCLVLSDPYEGSDNDTDGEEAIPTMPVDIDLDLSAWANSRKYYDKKRSAAVKEQKTIDASQKALKSAEKKTQQTLKDFRIITNISRARKVYWFEKFFWFISSENYLVIGGRDAQQNEQIVKRYMRPSDIYVHAEIQGASSVVIQNPSGNPVPPKTLLEAGTMSISYSVAWDAKVETNAYWVYSKQVSKTAPTGGFLGTGSFMIRGKKNFLPGCHMILGVSILFKLEDSFVDRHRNERRVRYSDANENDEFTPDDMARVNDLNTIAEDVEEDVLPPKENIIVEEVESGSKNVSQRDENVSQGELGPQFPDTQVKIEHGRYRTERVPNMETLAKRDDDLGKITQMKLSLEEAEEETIIPAVASKKKQVHIKKHKIKAEHKVQESKRTDDPPNKANTTQVKGGRRRKSKKLNSQTQGKWPSEVKSEENEANTRGKQETTEEKAAEDDKSATQIKKRDEQECDINGKNNKLTNVTNIETEETVASVDIDMIDSLTGNPHDDDELLFAIPVVAPYQALQNYKYKIKITPGTAKRGRAAQSTLMVFSKDKSCNAREKDLLKAVKEEFIARNMPGKVKLSAPQLQKYKKK